MKGDFSRDTFDAAQHYSGVLMQQGRVQLDADWNEQVAIERHRTETETIDVIGPTGTPKYEPGFQITIAAGVLHVGAGRYYVDGLLCRNNQNVEYDDQPYLPEPPDPLVDFDEGTEFGIVYLRAWHRHITALNDPHIREVALGGPDTTTRVQTAWQVRVLPLPSAEADASGAPECGDTFTEWDNLIAAPGGTMNARTVEATTTDECKLPPSAGYLRLENQLYRVEIHEGGVRANATFKWSRDNGSVVAAVADIDGRDITISDPGHDPMLGFAAGGWVELLDDQLELLDGHGALLQIDTVDPDTGVITVTIDPPAVDMSLHPRLRRWDQVGDAADVANGVAMTASWIDLEDGIQVEFSNNEFQTGDYWLIPARTATGEIEWPPYAVPNTAPKAQPPTGTQYHFAPLAMVQLVDGVLTVIDDCRSKFPPLTKLCAEDICFDSGTCDFPSVETVQQAIDRLCKAQDLRFHNKHLHGWGIVCGLQVYCGMIPENGIRRRVTVAPGYALDCEGNDIRVTAGTSLDVLTMIQGLQQTEKTPLLDEKGDGDVCLRLGDAKGKMKGFTIERYTPDKNILDGTLLMDVYEDCIKKLVELVQDEFDVGLEDKIALVSPARKRLSTFLNLLVQFWNPNDGRFVYISPKEHKILLDFYTKLRAQLQSTTFCAMFDNARPFPDYPDFTKPTPSTIFGKGLHDRIRMHPSGQTAYTIGTSNRIYVYDLKKEEMIAELEFPAGESADVTDIAFSNDGKELYATAILDANDTIFATARISGINHAWGPSVIICDIHIVTLVASTATENVLYGIAQGKGFFQINPKNPETRPAARFPFNAFGHLVVLEKEGIAYASANAATNNPTSSPDTFDRVLRIDLKSEAQPKSINLNVAGQLQVKGRDDIAATANRLYVVTEALVGKTGKQLTIFDTSSSSNFPLRTSVNLGSDTEMRLGQVPKSEFLIISYEDNFRVNLLNMETEKLVEGYRHPVQIFPVSIAVHPKGNSVYFLNKFSNTISAVDAQHFSPGANFKPPGKVDLKELEKYRKGVIEAFIDLGGGLLQYLKDCFCDHLLVSCPDCTGEEKIYLACISIRNGQVYKVCNFSKRKYVKSAPAIEYWLSAIPILPMIGAAVEKLCCTVLPDIFGKVNVPASNAYEARFTGRQVSTATRTYQKTDIAGFSRKSTGSLGIAGGLAGDWLSARTKVTRVQDVSQRDVVGQSTFEATQQLQGKQVVVESVRQYDPAMGAKNLTTFGGAVGRIGRGDRVVIYEENGVVRYIAPAPTDVGSLDSIRGELDRTKAEVAKTAGLREEIIDVKAEVAKTAGLRDEVNSVRADVARTAGLRDEFIDVKAEVAKTAGLREELTSVKAEVAKTVAFGADLDNVKAAVAKTATFSADLNNVKAEVAKTATLSADLNNVKAEIAKNAAIRDEVTAVRNDVAGLKGSQQEVAVLRTQLNELQQKNAALEKSLNDARTKDLAEMRKLVETLQLADKDRTKELTDLRTELLKLQRTPGGGGIVAPRDTTKPPDTTKGGKKGPEGKK